MAESIREEIIRKLSHLENRKTGNNVFIKCPYHKDSTPSFSIYVGRPGSTPLGFGYCWGCGKKASWQEICDKLRIDSKLNGAVYAEALTQSARDMLLPRKLTLDIVLADLKCEGQLPIETHTWREIPKRLLKDMGCFYSDKVNLETMSRRRVLILPCYVEGQLVGAVRANLRKIDDLNTYYNSPGAWVLHRGYFGLEFSHKNFDRDMPIIVGEGPRDALSWIRDRYPATAILGSKTFSIEKARKLVNTRRKIIPFFDGDKAGIQASNLVTETFKELLGDMYSDFVFPYRTVRRAMKVFDCTRQEAIDMEIDPASMPDEIRADFLKHYKRVRNL